MIEGNDIPIRRRENRRNQNNIYILYFGICFVLCVIVVTILTLSIIFRVISGDYSKDANFEGPKEYERSFFERFIGMVMSVLILIWPIVADLYLSSLVKKRILLLNDVLKPFILAKYSEYKKQISGANKKNRSLNVG